jgi:creatinine amidohydrolase
VLILNGHGGNIAAIGAIANELGAELATPIAATTYWLLAREAFGKILERQTTVRHACEAETSMVLALAPELVDMELAQQAVGPTSPEIFEVAGGEVQRYRSFEARTSHGAIGDPRAASAEKGERLLDAAAEAVAALVANDAFWKLPA